MELTRSGRASRMLSDHLRHWVFDRYIPQNLKIRDPKTVGHYQRALDEFAEHLGREPVLSDLTDENLTALIKHLLTVRGQAERTANGSAGRITAFWRWAAMKRQTTGVEEFPSFSYAPEPEKIPI